MQEKLFNIIYNDESCQKVVEGPYMKETIYNQNGDMVQYVWVKLPEHLDNTNMPQTNPEFLPIETGDDNMAKIRRGSPMSRGFTDFHRLQNMTTFVPNAPFSRNEVLIRK